MEPILQEYRNDVYVPELGISVEVGSPIEYTSFRGSNGIPSSSIHRSIKAITCLSSDRREG